MKISIITISFNSEKTIEETIKSVIEQDYDDLEYIIVDGASTDRTMEIVEKYRSKISKIISEKDEGISDAFNKGIHLATGDIIGIINSDDMLYPGAIKKLGEYYEPDVDVYYGDGVRLFQNGMVEDYMPKNLQKMKQCMALVHPSTFVSKVAYLRYGVFDCQYKACMDRELLIRMLSAGARFKYIPEKLSVYRMGGYSHQQFMTRVREEREKISLCYGASKLSVKLFSLKCFCVMNLKKYFKGEN